MHSAAGVDVPDLLVSIFSYSFKYQKYVFLYPELHDFVYFAHESMIKCSTVSLQITHFLFCFVQKHVVLYGFVLGHYSSIFKIKSILSAHIID